MNDTQSFYVYGIHALKELLKAKKRSLKKVYISRPAPKNVQDVLSLIPKHIPIVYTERKTLEKIVETPDHQGIVAVTTVFPVRKTFFTTQKHPVIIMLDSIQDPRNVGALLRSAYCTGMSGAVLCAQRSSPLTPTVFKTSAGLAEHLDVYVASSISSAVQEAKKAGYTIYIAALGGNSLIDIDFKTPCCIVIGNEEKGVSKEILSQGTIITIDQKDPLSSYNASVAGGIIMFYCCEKTKLLK